LFGLLGKDVEFKWTDNYQGALDELKDKLVFAPILRGTNWALPFHIHTDASNKVIGVGLGKLRRNDHMPYIFLEKSCAR